MGITRNGNTDGVIRLLEEGATNDHVNKRGNTALHFAVRFGYHEIVKAIIHQFPNECERKNVMGDTPLSERGQIEESFYKKLKSFYGHHPVHDDNWKPYAIFFH